MESVCLCRKGDYVVKLSVDEIIDGLKEECAEQKDTIKYLEQQEEMENYISVHRKVVEFLEQNIKYLEELKQYKSA